MKSTIIKLPGVMAANPVLPPVVIEDYDERIASWEGLLHYVSPEHVNSWSPFSVDDRAADYRIIKDPSSGSAPTEDDINGRPAFKNGGMRSEGDAIMLPKTATIAFVVEFIGTLPTTDFSLIRVHGGGNINFQSSGTRPAISGPPSFTPPYPMPEGTISAADTPYLFLWAWDEAADAMYRQVNGVTDSIASLNSKIPFAPTYFRTNWGTQKPFKIGKIFIFDVNLFRDEHRATRLDVIDFLKSYYGVTW